MRELENVIERAVVLARGARIETAELPDSVVDRSVMIVRGDEATGAEAAAPGEGFFKIKLGTPLAEVEARVLEETLRMTKGNKTLAARSSASTRPPSSASSRPGRRRRAGATSAAPGKAAGG